MNGIISVDEGFAINGSISGTIFHALKLVVDNRSLKSTKVYLDDQFIGSIQEHFVPRLKGGVFVLNKFEGVALFKNFSLRECNNFSQNGTCLEGILLYVGLNYWTNITIIYSTKLNKQ